VTCGARQVPPVEDDTDDRGVVVFRPAQYERPRWTGERIRNEAPTLAKQLPLFSSARRNDLAVREGHRVHA
jgi:hypothetical protein